MTAPKHFNQTVLGRTEAGIAHDDFALSKEEAEAASVIEQPVRERVGAALRQKGVSPKILADFIVSVVIFAVLALTGFPITNDPVVSAFLSKLAGSVAAYLLKPGTVVVDANELKEVSP